jgi:hypothetical protein
MRHMRTRDMMGAHEIGARDSEESEASVTIRVFLLDDHEVVRLTDG